MNELSVEYAKAVDLDRRIKVSAQLAQQSLYDMCMGFKEMRDSKLYKELGYQNFEDYCEQEAGMKRCNVHKYIAIVEKLPQDFVSPVKQIGVKKLYLLTTLSDEERTEIAHNTDLESTSFRELEQQIRQIRAEKDKAVADKSAAEAEASAAAQQAKSLEKAKNALSQQIAALEAEIKELENRPIEVAVESNSHEVENLMDAMKRVDLDWSLKYSELQEETMKETIRNNQEHTAEIERLKAEYEEKLANAEPVSDSKAVFKAYLSNAVDAVKRLAAFVQEHPDEVFFRNKTREFFENINKSMEV